VHDSATDIAIIGNLYAHNNSATRIQSLDYRVIVNNLITIPHAAASP